MTPPLPWRSWFGVPLGADPKHPYPDALMLDFTGQIAIVTGASKGIGYFMAKELATAGAHVIAVARSKDGLRKLQNENDGMVKDRFTLMTVDLTDMDAVDGLGKFVESRWAKADVLI